MQSGNMKRTTYENDKAHNAKLNKKPTDDELKKYKDYNDIPNFDKWDQYIKPGR